MKYLSWDIGIKNLAYCLLETTPDSSSYRILKWEIINLQESQKKATNFTCQGHLKNGSVCSKNATWYNFDNEKYYCATHRKKFADQKIQEIKQIKCQHVLPKKNTLCGKKIGVYLEGSCLGYCKTHQKKYIAEDIKWEVRKDKKEKYDLEKVSIRLIEELDQRPELLESEYIMIENQPAFKNPKMKSIQMIIYTYFLIRGKLDLQRKIDLQFLLASNKLKVKFADSQAQESIITEINQKYKDKYRRHKEAAKKYCEWYLNHQVLDSEKWLDIYGDKKKQDDLADTFLMNIYKIQLESK